MPTGLLLFIFGLLSAPLVFISRASLRRPGSHGFYRFFAWEAILGLALLNLPAWFKDPFARHQIISWLLLIASLALVAAGVHLLSAFGGTDPDQASDVPKIGIEKTTSLVTTGIYGYIRHPLYSSLLFLTWGVFFKRPSWTGSWQQPASRKMRTC
jgi:protein-S-isoprenylcysteine O-methyltransferase Ste14